jgi:hypothetical protein
MVASIHAVGSWRTPQTPQCARIAVVFALDVFATWVCPSAAPRREGQYLFLEWL